MYRSEQHPGGEPTPPFRARYISSLIGSTLACALAACAVGPNFSAPKAPAGAGDHYNAGALAKTVATAHAGRAGTAQQIAYGAALPTQWWSLFHSAALDRLMRDTIAGNPTLAAAQASLRQAQENYNAAAGTVKYPTIAGQACAARERQQLAASAPSVFNVFSASINVSYTLDVFGGAHRQLESLAAAVDYQRYQTEAAYQTLEADVATTAIQAASVHAQRQATQALLDAERKQLDIINKQLALGAVNRTTQLAQATLVAQTAAQLPVLDKAMALLRHQLSVYIGKLPGDGGVPELTLDSLQLPDKLPVSLPSTLVRQRPDVQASEALLHEASAQLGVAMANQYPQFDLTGSYTAEHVAAGAGGTGVNLWSLGAGIVQPIFNGGALSAKRRAAEAALDEAQANYRETVLKAFQNVADALRAIDEDAKSLQAQADATRQARLSLDLTRQQYALGAVSDVSLLGAERSYQQSRIAMVQAQAARYADTAALFAALGGGWWHKAGTAGQASHT